ncbi:flippase activity-associated protein Agl23 [Halobellus inordinatus]|uniref:flippase activity-associated protein Agl23 n=1 Tax=Halobellus inordinatus TaxID=1126236 RepID=UPI00210B1CBE|nr:flippase activity-associated protein Agl23 [Halobellus inordinatus]
MSREGDAAPGGSERTPVSASLAGLSFRRDRVLGVVVALAFAGLLVRLVGLGARPFHWDEARVGYWTLRYLDTGAYQYRPIAGGPLLPLVGRTLFALVGVSEWVARLPIAVLGAALPLVALLFRDRLDDAETVLFAALLAFQPLVLYYSRFLRGDVPLALFGFAFVGFALRAWDRDSRRDAYAAAVALSLAASASGFVAGYLCCWLAVWVLVVEQHSVAADGGASARAAAAALRARLAGTTTAAARAALLFIGTTVFLFAPRAGPGVDVGLYDPTEFHLAIYEGTVGALWRFVGVRVVNRYPDGTHSLLPYLGDAAGTLTAVALPVVAVGVGTTLWVRYASARRPLIEGVGYWGLLAVILFPTIAEVSAPWTLVHVVVPLSLPAAVGFAAFLRRGAAAASGPDVDAGTVVAVALVVLAVVAQVGAVTAGSVYGSSDRDNRLAQFAQPSGDLEPIEAAARAAADGDSSTAEVLYVGAAYHVPPDRTTRFPPVGDAWGNRLPLTWYVEAAGADATSTANASTFDSAYANASAPPVVIAAPTHHTELAERLGSDYEATTYRLGLWNREVVVFTAPEKR